MSVNTLEEYKKNLQFLISDVENKEVKKIDIVQENIFIMYENGETDIKCIYKFIIEDCFLWFYKQGYYVTMNYAPKIICLYPKSVETHEFSPFSKGDNLLEATINLYKWIKQNITIIQGEDK